MTQEIFLHRFGYNYGLGPIGINEARVLMTLLLLILVTGFIFWRYGNVFSKIRDWYRVKTRVPFERLSQQRQAEILQNAWCIKCGQQNILIMPKEEMLRGEHVIRGKCPKCKGTVEIRS